MNLKVGDLVDFGTNAWVFKSAEQDYSNPGIILEIEISSELDLITARRTKKATVLWADGRTTKEYFAYLREKNN